MKFSFEAFLLVASSSFAFGHDNEIKKEAINPGQSEVADVGILFQEERPESRALVVIKGIGSCGGTDACKRAARGGGSFKAGDGSCIYPRACENAAYYGSFNVGDKSCIGERSCYSAGYEGDFTAGNGSCLGEKSCQYAGYDAKVEIGIGSCIGEGACIQIKREDFGFTVGNNSCTCKGCCKNLLSGSEVGNCQCISEAEGCSGTKVTPQPGICASNSPSLAPSVSNSPSDSPSVSSSPSSGPSSSPSSLPSSLPSMAPSIPRFQDLVFDKPSNTLGLTQSEETVDLSHLLKNEDVPQHLNFSQTTKTLSLSGSNNTIDLSGLVGSTHQYQHLNWNDQTKMLALSNSSIDVNLSGLLQALQFNTSTRILSLSHSNDTVDLSHFLSKADILPQHLNFAENTNMLSLSDSDSQVNLSSLVTQVVPQNLAFSELDNKLTLSGSNVTVDLSSLDKDLNWNESSKLLSLTHSDSSSGIDLSSLVQDLTFDTMHHTLGLSVSNATVDLSHLVNVQGLTFDSTSNILGLTESNATVDLSHLVNRDAPPAQDLSFNKTSKVLSLSGSDSTVDLSSLVDTLQGPQQELVTGAEVAEYLRLTTIQGTIDKIDGKASESLTIRRGLLHQEVEEGTPAVSARRLKKGDKNPEVGYGGLKGTRGWTIFSTGRLLGITIATTSALKPGSGDLRVALLDCSGPNGSMYRLGEDEDTLIFKPGDGRAKIIEFATPIPIQAGSILCFEAIRSGEIDSLDKDNSANVLIMLEQ